MTTIIITVSLSCFVLCNHFLQLNCLTELPYLVIDHLQCLSRVSCHTILVHKFLDGILNTSCRFMLSEVELNNRPQLFAELH